MNLMDMAFRNVFRNKKRTFLTALTILMASIIVALAIGLINGMVDSILANFIDFQTGNYKITTKGFVEREQFMPVDEYITGIEKLKSDVLKIEGVTGAEERISFGILLGSGDNTVSAGGMGLDLIRSRMNIGKNLIRGTMEDSGIYIGYGLASKLKAQLNDEILLATKTSEGGLNGIKLPVRGILQFNISVFDSQFFFINLNDARRLLKMNGTSELLVFTGKKADPDKTLLELRKTVSSDGGGQKLIVRSPSEQIGAYYDIIKLTKGFYYLFEVLIMLLASFVVVNTMMMAVFERMPEIGTMKAMGMTDRELFINFILEGTIIGGMGGITGGMIGYWIDIYLARNGLSFQKTMENINMPFSYVFYPSIGIDVLVIAILIAIAISAFSAIIPARYARKLTPAEALKAI